MLTVSLPSDYHNYPSNNLNLTNFTNILFIYPIYYLHKIQSKKPTLKVKLLYTHLFALLIASTYYHTTPNDNTIIPDMFAVSTLTLLSSIILLDISTKKIIYIYIISLLTLGYFKQTGNLLGHILILGGVPGYVAFVLWNTGINKELIQISALMIMLRLVEYNDKRIYNYTKFINGHSLKHILSVCAIIKILQLMKKLHKI